MVDKSMISRELRRNKDDLGEYVAETASSLSSARRTRTRFQKTTKEVEEMIVERFRHHPEIVKSITVDNGTEFALHDEVEVQLKTRVFYAGVRLRKSPQMIMDAVSF